MTEKYELKFSVLTDMHNDYARRLGAVRNVYLESDHLGTFKRAEPEKVLVEMD